MAGCTSTSWTLETGCCGSSLRTTSLVMGYINLTISIIFCVIMIVGVALGAAAAEDGVGTEDSHVMAVGTVLMVLSSITLVFCLILLSFIATLLVGLHKTKRNLVKVFLIGAGIIYVINAINFFSGAFLKTENGIIVGVRGIILAVQVYTFFVVRSYYLKMETTGEVATFTNNKNNS